MADTLIDLRAPVVKYRFHRGDDFADTVTIREGDPLAPADVSGRTYTAQVRATPSGAVVAEMDIDMTDAASGVVGYALGDEVTGLMLGDYGADLEQDVGGSVRTILSFKFKVDPDYTREP